MISQTAKAPMNIATVKYWGKADEEKMIPLNSSISATLHADSLHTITKVTASHDFKEHKLVINGVPVKPSKRFLDCIDACLKLSEESYKKFHVETTNSFPTGAGLASSASGYACLVKCLSKILNIGHLPAELSRAAALGSGSACRSMHGGWVEWDAASNSSAQLRDENWWPELRVLILIVDDDPKKVGSTVGMRRSAGTSEYLRLCAPAVRKRLGEMRRALAEKSFGLFAETTMAESNRLHAVCLDSAPPIFYLTDVSKRIVDFVHAENAKDAAAPKLAYSFDAGANAFLFCEDKDLSGVVAALRKSFGWFLVEDKLGLAAAGSTAEKGGCGGGGISKAIVTKVGPGR